jgi:multidrug efflux system membrane fusion protein
MLLLSCTRSCAGVLYTRWNTHWKSISVKKKWFFIIGIFLTISIVRKGVHTFSHTPQPVLRVPSVRGKVFKAQLVNPILSLSGITKAARIINLKAEIEGRIVECPIKKGHLVKEGDVLLRIIDNDRAARLHEAEARLFQREAEFNASTNLKQKALKSENSHLASKSELEAARAFVKKMNVEVDRQAVKSPLNGYYEQQNVEVGDYVNAGDKVATILQLNPLKIETHLSEADSASVYEGQEVHVKMTNNSSQTLKARVIYKGRVAEPKTRTFLIECEIDNLEGFASGQTCQLMFIKKPIMAHSIPSSALVLNDAGVLGVMGIDDKEHSLFYPIHVEQMQHDHVLISGVPDTFTLITTGGEFVKHGCGVKLKDVAS